MKILKSNIIDETIDVQSEIVYDLTELKYRKISYDAFFTRYLKSLYDFIQPIDEGIYELHYLQKPDKPICFMPIDSIVYLTYECFNGDISVEKAAETIFFQCWVPSFDTWLINEANRKELKSMIRKCVDNLVAYDNIGAVGAGNVTLDEEISFVGEKFKSFMFGDSVVETSSQEFVEMTDWVAFFNDN